MLPNGTRKKGMMTWGGVGEEKVKGFFMLLQAKNRALSTAPNMGFIWRWLSTAIVNLLFRFLLISTLINIKVGKRGNLLGFFSRRSYLVRECVHLFIQHVWNTYFGVYQWRKYHASWFWDYLPGITPDPVEEREGGMRANLIRRKEEGWKKGKKKKETLSKEKKGGILSSEKRSDFPFSRWLEVFRSRERKKEKEEKKTLSMILLSGKSKKEIPDFLFAYVCISSRNNAGDVKSCKGGLIPLRVN